MQLALSMPSRKVHQWDPCPKCGTDAWWKRQRSASEGRRPGALSYKCIACHRTWTRRKFRISPERFLHTEGACAYCRKAFERTHPQQLYCTIRCRRAVEIARREHRRAPPNEPCATCGTVTKLVWDHDHETGRFRGWLCNHCNGALGFGRDDPRILRALAQYLERAAADMVAQA